jgi:hypothetical protein
LQQRGVEFVSLKDHNDTSSAIGKAMFRMLAEKTELTGVSKATLYRRLKEQEV